MADFSSRFLVNDDSVPTIYSREKSITVESCEHLVGRGGTAGNRPSSSVTAENGNWGNFGGMDQITVVRIDDSHIAELQAQPGEKVKEESMEVECYEVEYSGPVEEESTACTGAKMTAGESLKEMEEEEEEEGVYVIEYSNPEEEGESYQFKMSVDRQLQTKEQIKRPAARKRVRRPLEEKSGSKEELQQRKEKRSLKRKNKAVSFCCSLCDATFDSKESLLQHEAEHSNATDPKKMQLVCKLCPPPGRHFKKMSGLAMHLNARHYKEGKKGFLCTMCKKTVRSQCELDAHTRRHANQWAVFKCALCAGKQEFQGSRRDVKDHLVAEHPGVIPRCDICNKGFKTIKTYMSDQFTHVGVSPFYCSKCKKYEMTERGLLLHVKNHNLKNVKRAAQAGENHPLSEGLISSAENSATDDSDS